MPASPRRRRTPRRTPSRTAPAPRPSGSPPGSPPSSARCHGGRRRPVPVGAERLGREVDVHLAGERVRHDERRRGEVVHLHLRVDAPLEVAVPREDGRDDEVGPLHGLGDRLGKRAGVADAGRAAVADEVEAERLEVGHEARVLEVVRDDLRAGRERGLHPGLRVRPRSTAFFARRPAPIITDGFDVFVQDVIDRDHDGALPGSRTRSVRPCTGGGSGFGRRRAAISSERL